MLPFAKRPIRADEVESFDCSERAGFGVLPPARAPAVHARPRFVQHDAALPSFEDEHVEDEATCVRAPGPVSAFPPAGARASRVPSARPRVFEPRAAATDEDCTTFRPVVARKSMATHPGLAAPQAPPASTLRVQRPAYVPAARAQRVSEPPPVIVQTPMQMQRLQMLQMHQQQMHQQLAQSTHGVRNAPPPSGTIPPVAVETVRTAPGRSRSGTLLGRPTLSWAAALVAMGVFVGLVTAIVARGDADSLVDATASLVDPAHPSVQAAGVQLAAASVPAAPLPAAAQVAQPVAVAPLPVAVAPAAPVVLPPAPAPIPLIDARQLLESPAIEPVPAAFPSASSVVFAQPRAAAPPARVAAPVAAAPRPVVARIAAPAPELRVAAAPAPRAEAKAKGRRGAAAADDDAAILADKLAREQLEAALK